MRITVLLLTALTLGLISCSSANTEPEPKMSDIQQRLAKYTTVKLEADLSALTEKQRQMIPILKDAAAVMDELFWLQNYGDKITLLAGIEDENAKAFARINYGPWDWLADNEPFIEGAGPKPLGANFYPADITKEEFEEAVAASSDDGAALKSLYTVIRRDAGGKLVARPYHEAFKPLVEAASRKLKEAAALAEDPGLKNYLELRAVALRDDDYFASDMAWMDMKSNTVDIVIGPIETYEDQLFGYKAGYEAYILIKDKEWSARLEKYAAFLPELQRGLPVPDRYKSETPGSDADLNAYDAIYYAGHCNMGSKTIAINLPNDERVQLEKGTRRLQLKNAMRAKFDKILTPIASLVIAEDQRRHVTFDAFFANTMFHEVAHGLGVKNTITGKGPVRQAMQEHASALEEGKADILGLYMITALHEKGELGGVNLQDNYVTFLAGLFRSIRFGGASAHAKANLLRFNYFKQAGAFTRDPDGTYRVNFEQMQSAVDSLSEKIIRLQGDGDYSGAAAFVTEMGTIGPTLQSDLDKIAAAGIPIDIVFEM